MSLNTDIMAGVMRSIKKAAQRHDRGDCTDFELIEAANLAIARMDICRPLTAEDKASYTRTQVDLMNARGLHD